MDNDTIKQDDSKNQTNANATNANPNFNAPPTTPPSGPPGPPPIEIKPNPQPPDQDHLGVGTPNIGVEREELPTPVSPTPPPTAINKTENKLEIADYEAYPSTEAPTKTTMPQTNQPHDGTNAPINIKNYQDSSVLDTPRPPIPASSRMGGRLILIIIFALLIGGAGGFFGFKYWDHTKSKASTENVVTSETTPEESSVDLSKWKIYNSTLYNYSLKYPNGWFASDTGEKANSIIFASNEASLSGTPTGYKIEIDFQNSNNQTLKKWVEANAASMGENNKAKEITVSGQTAYQQELTKTGNKVATYVERPDKIMIVTYSAPEDLYGLGGDWYNNLVNSIKLM